MTLYCEVGLILAFANFVQDKRHRCGEPTYDVGSNSFIGVNVYHNVGSQEGGACLDG
jgi:hypothetical protein